MIISTSLMESPAAYSASPPKDGKRRHKGMSFQPLISSHADAKAATFSTEGLEGAERRYQSKRQLSAA
ncbi:hypothetical protein [Sagittula sp.]|uniref:hypothetical protein n=1 Tax=Sagittula sp. TaxID=2038081 RepID=UPI004059DB02